MRVVGVVGSALSLCRERVGQCSDGTRKSPIPPRRPRAGWLREDLIGAQQHVKLKEGGLLGWDLTLAKSKFPVRLWARKCLVPEAGQVPRPTVYMAPRGLQKLL